jgi:hypothetical protein
MMFFDPHGNPISSQQWLNTYEPAYFICGPTFPPWFDCRSQTSRHVETEVCALLKRTTVLSLQDLILFMAWKMGEIDQCCSEIKKSIVYCRCWNKTLHDRRGKDFSSSINYLTSNMATIQANVSQRNLNSLFDQFPRLKHSQLTNFGPVYLLTVLFFITQGSEPIYDQYAHKAALAIDQGVRPGQAVTTYKAVEEWPDYDRFKNLLRAISRACSPQSSTMFISRSLDRALFVYGHLFRVVNPSRVPKTPCNQVAVPGSSELSGDAPGSHS